MTETIMEGRWEDRDGWKLRETTASAAAANWRDAHLQMLKGIGKGVNREFFCTCHSAPQFLVTSPSLPLQSSRLPATSTPNFTVTSLQYPTVAGYHHQPHYPELPLPAPPPHTASCRLYVAGCRVPLCCSLSVPVVCRWSTGVCDT